MKFFGSSLLLVTSSLLVSPAAAADANKRLIVFAGPHATGASAVEQFFMNHVSNLHPLRKSQALDGWLWPHVLPSDLGMSSSVETHKVWDLLVTQASNSQLQQKLQSQLLDAWKNSTHGIIVTSEQFDQIGTRSNPTAGIDAVQSVVDTIGVSNDKVDVVLNYRSPRLDQWVSLFEHTTDGQDNTLTYREYVCGDNVAPERWDDLESIMNPLKIAQAFRKKWKVVVLDLAGIEEEGLDASHVLACEVMLSSHEDSSICPNGYVPDKASMTYDSSKEPVNTDDFSALNANAKKKVESMLDGRDCFYQSTLQPDPQFNVLHRSKIWKDCRPKQADDYAKLTDSNVLLTEIRAQKDCGPSNDVNVEQVGNTAKGSSTSPTKSSSGGKKFGIFLAIVAWCAVAYVVIKRRNKKDINVELAVRAELETSDAFRDVDLYVNDGDLQVEDLEDYSNDDTPGDETRTTPAIV